MEPDLPRSPASRRGRSQEGSCCPERTPRLLTSTTRENGGRQAADSRRRTATRRLVLRRELLKDAIYMATKAVDKYGRRERRTADGDKKARAAQRDTQGCHLHGYQGCRQVQQERTADGRRRTANGRRERRQEGSCCAESCLRMPRELATVKKKDS